MVAGPIVVKVEVLPKVAKVSSAAAKALLGKAAKVLVAKGNVNLPDKVISLATSPELDLVVAVAMADVGKVAAVVVNSVAVLAAVIVDAKAVVVVQANRLS